MHMDSSQPLRSILTPGARRLRRVLGVAALALAVAACASAATLDMKPSETVMPIVNATDAEEAVGQCLRFSQAGPVTAPCPLGVHHFFDRARVTDMPRPGGHLHGVFTRGRDTADLAHETVVAYEMVTYNVRALPWKSRLRPRDVEALRAVCAEPRHRREMIIVRALEGCAVVLAGHRRDSWRWTMETLATRGTVIGQPDGFWVQDPRRALPPQEARCQNQRVVQVEVSPLGAACDRYQAELFPEPQANPPLQEAAVPR